MNKIKESGPVDLTQLYDNIKSESNPISDDSRIIKMSGASNMMGGNPGIIKWRKIAAHERDKLADDCRKHILVDLYCKIIPLDDDYVDTHHGQLAGDVDDMLASKGMTATQYLTSASEKTKAPVLEYVLRATNLIAQQFMEDAEEILKDAQENDMDIPTPEAPSVDDKEIESQLVDVEDDVEYDAFVDALKKKTIDKIVNDVSKIITKEKEENDMSFNPKPIADQEAEMESTVSIGLNYIQKKFMKENVDIDPDTYDEMLGLAMREATLNHIDVVFKQPYSDFKNFASNIRYGKGVLINESSATYLCEAAKSTDEVNKVIEDANKESEDKINSNLKASDVIKAKNEEEEKKKFTKREKEEGL